LNETKPKNIYFESVAKMPDDEVLNITKTFFPKKYIKFYDKIFVQVFNFFKKLQS